MYFQSLFSKLIWKEEISSKVFLCPQISFSRGANFWTKHSRICEFPEERYIEGLKHQGTISEK